MTWIWHGFLLQRHVLIMSCASQEKRTGVGVYTASLTWCQSNYLYLGNSWSPQNGWAQISAQRALMFAVSRINFRIALRRRWRPVWMRSPRWMPPLRPDSFPGIGRSLEGQCGKGMGGNWWFLDKQWLDYWEDERFSLVSKDAGCCRQCLAQAPQTQRRISFRIMMRGSFAEPKDCVGWLGPWCPGPSNHPQLMIQLSHCPETRHDGHDPVKGFAAPSAKAPIPPAQALPGSDHLKLHYDRRWGSWRSNAVGVVAVVWADMQVEMENGLGQLSSLIQEIRKRLCEAFGKDAVVGSSLKLSEVFFSRRLTGF